MQNFPPSKWRGKLLHVEPTIFEVYQLCLGEDLNLHVNAPIILLGIHFC
jgi:hypothetical protein